MTKQAKTEQAQAIESLREILKPGDTVYTILRSVSRSGMTRHISTVIPSTEERTRAVCPSVHDVTYLVARVLEYRMDRNDGGLVVSGAGMDMGFSVVYNIGRRLWPDGFKTWPGYWRNEPMDFDPDGGYALHHRWL